MTSAQLVAVPRGLVAATAPAAAIVNNPNRFTSGTAVSSMEFADFYAATFHGLCAQLYAYTGDLAAAQDVVQEAFCRALPRWSTLCTYDDPTAWVRKVAWNLATSRWRQLRRAADFTRQAREETIAAPGVERVDLMAALRTLPTRQRQAVVLHYLADASIAEIAQITSAAEGTVKSWLHRARASLAEQLRTDGAEGGKSDDGQPGGRRLVGRKEARSG